MSCLKSKFKTETSSEIQIRRQLSSNLTMYSQSKCLWLQNMARCSRTPSLRTLRWWALRAVVMPRPIISNARANHSQSWLTLSQMALTTTLEPSKITNPKPQLSNKTHSNSKNTPTIQLILDKCTQTVSQSLLLQLRQGSLRPIRISRTRMRGLQCLTSAGWSTATFSRWQTATDSMDGKCPATWSRDCPSSLRLRCALCSRSITSSFLSSKTMRIWTLMKSASRLTMHFWIATTSCFRELWTSGFQGPPVSAWWLLARNSSVSMLETLEASLLSMQSKVR